MKLLVKLAINGFAVWVATAVLPGLSVDGGFDTFAWVAVVFALVNTFIRPIVKLLTFPLRAMTLGLFTLVVNGFMVIVTTWVVEAFVIDGGLVKRILVATGAAFIISLVSGILYWLVPRNDETS
jgi:putative membrane protein